MTATTSPTQFASVEFEGSTYPIEYIPPLQPYLDGDPAGWLTIRLEETDYIVDGSVDVELWDNHDHWNVEIHIMEAKDNSSLAEVDALVELVRRAQLLARHMDALGVEAGHRRIKEEFARESATDD